MIKQEFKDLIYHESWEHTPEDKWGIFILGKRITTTSGNYFWDSEASAKRAFAYHIKSMFYTSRHLDKYNIKFEEAKLMTAKQLLEAGIAEIKVVGKL
jgi:hypothetical protein